MVDSKRRPVALLTVSTVEVIPLIGVDRRIAVGEGEGLKSVDQWRTAHMDFWTSKDLGRDRRPGIRAGRRCLTALETAPNVTGAGGERADELGAADTPGRLVGSADE
jgi:hypothetical protein